MQDFKVILSFKTIWELLTKPICKKWSSEIYAEQCGIQCSFLAKVVKKGKLNEFSNESAKQPQLDSSSNRSRKTSPILCLRNTLDLKTFLAHY